MGGHPYGCVGLAEAVVAAPALQGLEEDPPAVDRGVQVEQLTAAGVPVVADAVAAQPLDRERLSPNGAAYSWVVSRVSPSTEW